MPRGVYPRKHKATPEIPESTSEAVERKDERPSEEAIKKAREANDNRNKSRLELMEQIADGSDDFRSQDLEETDGDRVIIKDDAEERELRAQQESEEAERVLAEAKAKELQEEGAREPDGVILKSDKEPEQPKLTKIVVNGREQWLTSEQLIERAQKVASADEYLQTAAEAARKAAAGPVPSRDERASLSKDELKKTLSAATLGDEEAIDRLASVLASPSGLTSDDLQKIDHRVSFNAELAAAKADQADVLSDPDLSVIFYSRLDQLKVQSPDTPIRAAFKQIGDGIREKWLKKAAPLADKETRKRSLPPPINAAGRQAMAEVEEDEDEPVENIIAQMAKSRGQTPTVHRKGERSNFTKG